MTTRAFKIGDWVLTDYTHLRELDTIPAVIIQIGHSDTPGEEHEDYLLSWPGENRLHDDDGNQPHNSCWWTPACHMTHVPTLSDLHLRCRRLAGLPLELCEFTEQVP